jgi:NitT/TauT family transport system substrate-binding protein
VLVAKGERLEEDPDAIRLFIAALARGTAAATEDPGLAIKSLLDANPELDRRITRAEVAATLPLLEPRQGQPFGYMDPTRWREFIGWMRDNDLISSLPTPDEVLSNDYLPGNIPD